MPTCGAQQNDPSEGKQMHKMHEYNHHVRIISETPIPIELVISSLMIELRRLTKDKAYGALFAENRETYKTVKEMA